MGGNRVAGARRSRRRRRGATVVEMAITAPILFLLLIGMMVGSVGVFRYHQVAALAHESARWASVHGKDYASDHRTSMATSNDIYTNVIQPRMSGLDPNRLTYSLTWGENNKTVSVTVTYRWIPEAFLNVGTLSNTAEMLVSY
jgi:Flp pilus assembly protein TadG